MAQSDQIWFRMLHLGSHHMYLGGRHMYYTFWTPYFDFLDFLWF